MAEPTDVIPYEVPTAPATLFRTDDPAEVVLRASAMATALKDVIVRAKLTSNIQGREYVRVEGWTLLGTMLGVFPVCTWTRQLDDGWEARVEARTRDGSIVGAAEASCLRSENNWGGRDDYALRSMAQTRATAKALRIPLGFVVAMAGYEATPAEEMVTDRPQQAGRPAAPTNGVPMCPTHRRAMKAWGGRNGDPPVWKCTARVGDGYCTQTAPRGPLVQQAIAAGGQVVEEEPPMFDEDGQPLE